MPGSKILIVEDDDTLRETLQYNLEKEGYTVLLARDGGAALEQARAVRPDLMLLDLMLGLQQGQAYLPQGLIDIFLAQLALVAQAAEYLTKFFCQYFKHGPSRTAI